MSDFLTKQTSAFIAQNVYSTGGTTVGNIIDLAGYDGVALYHVTGVTTSAVTMVALGSATTDSFQAISGASVSSTAANRMLAIDLLRPGFRYIQTRVDSTGITGAGVVLAIKYHPHALPTTNSSNLLECDQVLNGAT